MKYASKTVLAAAALAIQMQPAIAQNLTQVGLRTHPSQGEVQKVDGATATLATGESGIFVELSTTGLEPGHVYTLLMAIINSPGQCPALPCTPKDVLTRSEQVRSDVAYAGGTIVGEDGTAHFAHYQALGLVQGAFFDNGLIQSDGTEIHLVINDHGPAIEGREFDMLTTYRGGCTEESLPPAMPATARVQGEAGPNTCRMVQFAQFIPAQTAS